MYPFNFVRLIPQVGESHLITGQYIVDLREKTFIQKDKDIADEIFDYLLKCREKDITESDIPYLSNIVNKREIPVRKLDEDSLVSRAIQRYLVRWGIQGG